MKDGKSVAFGLPNEVLTPQLLEQAFSVRVLVDAHPITGVPRITPVHKGAELSSDQFRKPKASARVVR